MALSSTDFRRFAPATSLLADPCKVVVKVDEYHSTTRGLIGAKNKGQ